MVKTFYTLAKISRNGKPPQDAVYDQHIRHFPKHATKRKEKHKEKHKEKRKDAGGMQRAAPGADKPAFGESAN